MAYADFRAKFTSYAVAGQIARARWFNDVYKKVSPALKNNLRAKKYELQGDYAALDKFLAIIDRESRNIQAKERAYARRNVDFSYSHGILKKDNWRARSPTPPAPRVRERSLANPSEPPVRLASPSRPTVDITCYSCGASGHYANDCPKRR